MLVFAENSACIASRFLYASLNSFPQSKSSNSTSSEIFSFASFKSDSYEGSVFISELRLIFSLVNIFFQEGYNQATEATLRWKL